MAEALQKRLYKWRQYLILILTPLLLAPLPISLPSKEARCAYAILIMSIYWVTEVIPLAVTALLPLVLFPLLGVVAAKEICLPYFKDTTMLLIGGLIVAVAIEHWNLHKRIALRVLLCVGTQPRRLMLGFMSITSFLSMWISNTATTAMMVPIAEAVLQEIKVDELDKEDHETTEHKKDALEPVGVFSSRKISKTENIATKIENEAEIVRGETEGLKSYEDKEEENDAFFSRISKALVLCIAYAANVGGTATLTGTGPNLVFNGQAQSVFPDSPIVGFGQWFGYAFPQMVILLLLSWVWLQFFFLGCCSRKGGNKKRSRMQGEAIKRTLHKQYQEMGPMSFAEKAVLGHFVLLALLWLMREPKFVPGWASLFKQSYVKDATAAMIICFSLFIFPSQKPKIFCWNPEGEVTKPPQTILTWETVALKLPWNVVILLGGGFALAEAAKVSGLSQWIGFQLRGLNVVPGFAIVLIVCLITCAFTEVTSNVATATIFLPILGSLGESIGIHPWYFMIPATISCSFAFMLPVATPPNAIVFSYGHLKVKDMAKAGFGMNILGIIVLMTCVHLYGMKIFELDSFPDWALNSQLPPRNYSLLCKNVTM